MKLRLTILIALLTVAGFAVPGGAADDDARLIRNYRLTDLEGAEHTLQENRGEVIVVNFWASWCPPCQKELPVMDGWNDEWADRGARVAAISVDSDLKDVRRFVEEAGLDLDVYHDGPGGLAGQLELPFLPCTYVLDQSGEIVLTSGGASDEDLARVRDTVEQLLASPPSASLNTTTANGGAR